MKILQIIQKGQLRGAEIFACQLSEELNKTGHHSDILILDGKENELPYKLNYFFAGARLNKRFWDFKTYKKIARIIEQGNYDIVQANAGDTLKYAVFSKILYQWKAKLVFRNANNMSSFLTSILKKQLNKFLLKHTDFIISVSKKTKVDLINIFPEVTSKIEVGTIGTFNFDNVNPIKNETYPVFINIGSFVSEKNHSFLLDIFKELLEKYPDAELWLIGNGQLRKNLEHKVSVLKLEKKVKFFGYQNEVIPFLKSSTLMLMPSLIEGMPGVILESLSCGIPVVASNVGGISEVVINDKTGYIIDDYNINKYIQTIEKILSNNKLYNKLSEGGKNLIRDEYLIPKIAKKFENIYQVILNEKN